MPAFLNWLLGLLPTNPICMRLVQGGSQRMRHFYIRVGYLTVLMAALFLLILGGSSDTTFTALATKGAQAFYIVSYMQLGLICLLTPVFMAGAIAQEANPRTWDILLTTPLNNLQIVLGNLFGRLFFILALLFSTLPLFVAVQFFGGVPGESIFLSYMIAAAAALFVASVAVTLSVTRTAGRRAVFVFYITVVMYLFVTYAIDYQLRQPQATGSATMLTTWITPLNPFLVIEVLLRSNTYAPHNFTGVEASWLARFWLGTPIAAFSWLSIGSSVLLVAFSTVRLRVIGAKLGAVPWYRRMFGLGARDAGERPPRHVGTNPIVWREAVARGATLTAVVSRWGFAGLGLTVALIVIALLHTGSLTPDQFRSAMVVIVAAEIVIIALTALNMSATAVSKEREDGSLDILLTTPIQPGPYLYGKLRGLVQFLIPMLCVPVGTLLLGALYVLFNGLGNGAAVSVNTSWGTANAVLPVMLPEGAIAMPLALVPFIAFCVMVGLQWSIRSKGTIGSVIAAVGIVVAIGGVVGLCGMFAGNTLGPLGPILSAFNPINLVIGVVTPHIGFSDALGSGRSSDILSTRVTLVVGAVLAAGVYILIVYAMHTNMKRTFHMTVRRLAGQK